MTYQQYTIALPKYWNGKGFEFYSAYSYMWSHILRDIEPEVSLELNQLTASGQTLVTLFDHEHKVYILATGSHQKALSFHGLTAIEHTGSIPARGGGSSMLLAHYSADILKSDNTHPAPAGAIGRTVFPIILYYGYSELHQQFFDSLAGHLANEISVPVIKSTYTLDN